MFVVEPSPLLAAVIQSIRLAGPTLKQMIYKYTDLYITPAWDEELAKQGGSATQHQVLGSGTRAIAHDLGLSVQAAAGTTPLSGGLVPVQLGRAFEFGTADHAPRTYLTRNHQGTIYKVTRVTTNQMPGRSRTGWVVFPAARAAGARLMSLMTQTVVRTLHDAAEGKI